MAGPLPVPDSTDLTLACAGGGGGGAVTVQGSNLHVEVTPVCIADSTIPEPRDPSNAQAREAILVRQYDRTTLAQTGEQLQETDGTNIAAVPTITIVDNCRCAPREEANL